MNTSLDDIWQETLGLDDFDAGHLEVAITRNQRPAYGLTLVVHPLRRAAPSPVAVGQARPEPFDFAQDKLRPRVSSLSQVCLAWEQTLHCSFFPEEILHFTIYSLRRSRPEPLSPVELEELWSRLVSELQHILEATPSFTVSLRGLAVTANGAILIGVDDSSILSRLRRAAKAIPGVSLPRSYPPHVTIGQVLAPCGSTGSFRQTMDYLRAWQDASLGELTVPAVKLIYYSSRILVTVEREAEFALRQGVGKIA